MIHEEILQILSSEEKDAFLLNALNTIPQLRQQFEQQFAGKAPKPDLQSTFEQFCSVVEEQRKYWINIFESLDLENPDWDNWRPPHNGYIPDYEAAEMIAQEEVDRIFGHWADKQVKHLLAQQINHFFSSAIGIYEASYLAEINDDNYTLGDDPNDSLLGSLTEAVQKVAAKAAICHFNPLVLGEAVEHTVRYIAKKGISSGILTQQLDELFRQMGNDQKTLPHFAKALLQLPDAGPLFPRLSVMLARHNDPDSWPEQAEKLFPYDDQVARDLMLFYREHNRYTDFQRVAVICFKKKEYAFGEFLAENIDDAYDPEFTKAVLLSRSVYYGEIPFYRRARRWMTDEEKVHFRNKHKHDHLFYGLLLVEEKQYPQLLEMLHRDENIPFHDFDTLLEIIAEEMPERGFDLVRSKVSKLLSNQRGRDLYEHIVKWLVTIRNPENQKALSEFITTLYNHKPSLPALRDELRKSGLV